MVWKLERGAPEMGQGGDCLFAEFGKRGVGASWLLLCLEFASQVGNKKYCSGKVKRRKFGCLRQKIDSYHLHLAKGSK